MMILLDAAVYQDIMMTVMQIVYNVVTNAQPAQHHLQTANPASELTVIILPQHVSVYQATLMMDMMLIVKIAPLLV